MQHTFASGNEKGIIKIWKIFIPKKTNKQAKLICIQTLDKPEYPEAISVLCSSPCTKYLFSSAKNNSLQVWKKENGQFKHFQTLQKSIKYRVYDTTICLTPCGTYLFSEYKYRTINVWKRSSTAKSMTKWKCIQALTESEDGFRPRFHSLCTSHCGKKLFSGNSDGAITIWENQHDCWKGIYSVDPFKAHITAVTFLCSLPNRKHFISGSRSGKSIKTWKEDHNQCHCVQTLNKPKEQHIEKIASLCMSFCGTHFFAGAMDKSIKIWKKKHNEWQYTQTVDDSGKDINYHDTTNSLSLMPCEAYLFSVACKEAIKIWLNKRGKWQCIQQLDNTDSIRSLCLIKKKENLDKKERLEFLQKKSNMLVAARLWTKTKDKKEIKKEDYTLCTIL